MMKLDSIGISDYYKSMPFGKKDEFVRNVAESICKSSSTVFKKLSNGKWNALEIKLINEIFDKMQSL